MGVRPTMIVILSGQSTFGAAVLLAPDASVPDKHYNAIE